MALILLSPLIAVLLLVLLALSPVILAYMGVQWFRGRLLQRRFEKERGTDERFAILVYSESPNWQEYFETEILPNAEDHCVILNWSERRHWKSNPTIATQLYQHYQPYRAFNPMALIFWPSRRVDKVSFYDAFRDLKRGKRTPLAERFTEFWSKLDAAQTAWRRRYPICD